MGGYLGEYEKNLTVELECPLGFMGGLLQCGMSQLWKEGTQTADWNCASSLYEGINC